MKKAIFLLWMIVTTINIFSQTDFKTILNDEIYDLAVENDTVWICTGNGILIKANTQGIILDSIIVVSDSIDNALYSIAVDTNSVKWIATEGKGVYSYVNDTLINFTTKDGLAYNYTTSIAVDRQNRKWIGTEGQGISVYDGSNWKTVKVSEDKKEVAYSIKIDSNDTKWISTYFGIYKYTDTVMEKYTLNSYGYLSNGTLIDSKGNKWFGTSGNGVYKFDGENWIQFTTTDGLIDNWVLSLYEDLQGNIWYGSKMWGISMFNGQNWISIPNDEIINLEITSILVIPNTLKSTSTNKLWLGTKQGLYINENLVLGIDKEIIENNMTVYPNPADNYIFINQQSFANVEYNITNIIGHILVHGIVPENRKIDVSNMTKGVYILITDKTAIKFIKY